MKWSFAIGAFSAALAVGFGAIGAHLVESGHEKDLIELSAYYHLIHSLALFLTGLVFQRFHYSSFCFVLGIVFFSGSLYTSALSSGEIATGFAPLGGSLFIAGWVFLGIGCLRNR